MHHVLVNQTLSNGCFTPAWHSITLAYKLFSLVFFSGKVTRTHITFALRESLFVNEMVIFGSPGRDHTPVSPIMLDKWSLKDKYFAWNVSQGPYLSISIVPLSSRLTQCSWELPGNTILKNRRHIRPTTNNKGRQEAPRTRWWRPMPEARGSF